MDRPNNTRNMLSPTVWVFMISMAVVFASTVNAQNVVPKQVYLIVEKNRLIASNTRYSRFDELKIKPQEKIIEQAVGNAVIVVVTSERLIGYGASAGWRTLSALNEETPEQISVQDYAALIVTNKRMLNFSGRTGRWAQQRHSIH